MCDLKPALSFGAMLLLAGCASTGCDPSRAGFIEGITCDSNGGYQNRAASLGNGLAEAQTRAWEESRRARLAGEKADAAQTELSVRKAEMDRYDRNLQDMKRRINQAAAKDKADRETVRTIMRKLTELEHEQDDVRARPSVTALQNIQARQDGLLKLLINLE